LSTTLVGEKSCERNVGNDLCSDRISQKPLLCELEGKIVAISDSLHLLVFLLEHGSFVPLVALVCFDPCCYGLQEYI
jgi:hypothetical protein